MRALSELVNDTEPAFLLIQQWAAEGELASVLLPPAPARDQVLLDLQVTTRSPLGAIAYGTGGILIDSGWLRMLGSGNPRMTRNIAGWNQGRSDGFLLVADDVIGGFFAINGGSLGDDTGAMYYFAPDTVEWEPLNVGHTAFVQWAFSNKVRQFYSRMYWGGWEEDVKPLTGNQCFNFYPFLWSEEGSTENSQRRPVPVAEQYAVNLGGTP